MLLESNIVDMLYYTIYITGVINTIKTILAKNAGFCFGVKRAVELAYNEINSDVPVYTYGYLIHNDYVVSKLMDNGIAVINSLDELLYLKKGKIIIRSHGISKAEYEIILKSGFEIIDATCPFVSKIHHLAKNAKNEDRRVIILGNPSHPEVLGIHGWCDTPPIIVENACQARNLSLSNDLKYTLVAQTTFNHRDFAQIVAIFQDLSYDISSNDTVCSATANAQDEAEKIASESDIMLVIGDEFSSNTKKLYEICKTRCLNTFHLSSAADIVTGEADTKSISIKALSNAQRIGITAGASTPSEIIEEVFLLCQQN